ncbi:amidohydrolase [Kitasatospora sp. NPDC097643]|uniref:amidohydrolase n=1 Tax=Kitasatospora sp. NPDC097643 TaxID=3157230 RepID=UPI0033347BD7
MAVARTPVGLREFVGPRTRVIELAGGLVVPGFQDSHVHAPFAGRDRRQLSLKGLAGQGAYLDAIAAYAAAHPSRPWLLGGGWALEHFPRGLPRKEDLDRIVPARPVLLFNQDLHTAWLNSAALAAAGISKDSPDPPHGRIERDPATGEPTGALHEGAAYRVAEEIAPQPDRAEWEASILNAQDHLHSLGVTAWQDAWVTPATQAAYETLAAEGRLTARVVGALWWDRHRGQDQITDLLARREHGLGVTAPQGQLGSGFHPTSVKIMADGVLENFTGALLDPYLDGCGGRTGNRGMSYLDAESLASAVTALDRHGFQVHLHAIGDRAVRDSLNAIARARAAHGPSRGRHHIAHLQVVQPADRPRFAELGVVANCQAFWAQSAPARDCLTIPYLGRERSALQFPFASLAASGARLAMGSDWAVTTANPLEQIEVAVTRVSPDDRTSAPFLPEERLSLDDAFDAFTSGSAYVNHDDLAGDLSPGRRADLVLLDTDVFAPDFTADGTVPVADARVRLTVAAGSVVHTDGL